MNNTSNFTSLPNNSYRYDDTHKTINIDTKYKELYYQSYLQIQDESPANKNSNQVFWNYMMNNSMQNAIIQRQKRVKC